MPLNVDFVMDRILEDTKELNFDKKHMEFIRCDSFYQCCRSIIATTNPKSVSDVLEYMIQIIKDSKSVSIDSSIQSVTDVESGKTYLNTNWRCGHEK